MTEARFLRMRDVMDRTALSRANIYARIQRGDFPAPYKLGAKCARWSDQEVADWIKRQLGPDAQDLSPPSG